MDKGPLERLVAGVKASRKCRSLPESLISRIGTRELLHRRQFKEAVKATKSKLHQVTGAYTNVDLRYSHILKRLAADSEHGDWTSFRNTCLEVMAKHSSTRERVPDLESFYTTLLHRAGQVNTVVDLACGLNPLAIPWMSLPPGARYYAFDIDQEMMDFLNSFFPLAGIAGEAKVLDLGVGAPSVHGDVALLLKTLPCLEQTDKSRGLSLLQEINAPHIFVSYPTRSLTGKSKGMVSTYDQQFRTLVAPAGWNFERLDFPHELVFLIAK